MIFVSRLLHKNILTSNNQTFQSFKKNKKNKSRQNELNMMLKIQMIFCFDKLMGYTTTYIIKFP